MRSGGGFAACARCEFGGVFIKMGLSVCSPSACYLLVLQPRWRIVLQPGWRGSSVAAGCVEGTAFGSLLGCRNSWCNLVLCKTGAWKQ